MAKVLVTDPVLACEIIRERAATDGDDWTEVWNGVTVLPSLPNNEHQRLVMRLSAAFSAVIDWDRGEVALPGANVSDRGAGWITSNYRCPDVVVYRAGNPAVDHGTHWQGGPDLAVEIESPGQDAREKNDFYAAVGTRELLVIDRDPWAVELFRLAGGKLVSAGRSDATNPAAVASGVLPLAFALRDGQPRPAVVVTHTGTGQEWTA